MTKCSPTFATSSSGSACMADISSSKLSTKQSCSSLECVRLQRFRTSTIVETTCSDKVSTSGNMDTNCRNMAVFGGMLTIVAGSAVKSSGKSVLKKKGQVILHTHQAVVLLYQPESSSISSLEIASISSSILSTDPPVSACSNRQKTICSKVSHDNESTTTMLEF